MASERLESAVPDGEALRYTASLRGGGAVGLTDERLLIADDEVTSVEFASVRGVTGREVDWFVAVLSVALVGIGLLSGVEDGPLVGAAFVAAGVASVLLVYRKRGKVTVNVHGRGKPLAFHVDSTDEFLDHMGELLDRYEARMDAEADAEDG